MSQIPATHSPKPSLLQGVVNRVQREFAYTWRRTFTRGDLMAFVVVLGLLLMPVFAMQTAGWADNISVLVPITILGTILAFLLARSQFDELTALILHTAYGGLIVFGIQAFALDGPGGLRARVIDMAERTSLWFETVNSGGTSDDSLIPVLFLSVLYWFLVLNTLWHLFRLERVWLAIVPPALTLLVNNTNYLGDARLDIYLAAYLFFALLLVAHSHMKAREYEWFRNQIRYPRQVRETVMRIGAVMALLIMTFAWIFPAGADNDNWEQVQDFFGQNPLEELSDLWSRLFNSLEGRGIATADYYGGDQLDLGGPVQLGDDPVMRVTVDRTIDRERVYWRSTVFDTYDKDRGRWTQRRSVRAFRDSSGMTFDIGDDQARQTIRQDIKLDIPATSLVYVAPQPIELGLPVEALLNCVEGSGSDCVNAGRQADVAVVRGREVLRAGDEYEVVSSVSVATADELRSASTSYPDWVLSQYLQGGNDLSPRIRDLTAQIIEFSGATTPYDQAKVLEQWLRTNIVYDELIPPPPSNQDPLEWLLFDIRRGYCNYYSTAMVMMLRSQGIPARMAAGFAEGDYDPNTRTYTVIERDAHTWVEAYFPSYGWVEFEPTADEPPNDRPGDTIFSDNFPTLTPEPSPTPTALPTNTPQPTDTPQPTITPTQSVTPQGTPPPQVTATPTITPTATATMTPSITPTPTDDPNQAVMPVTDVESGDDGGSIWSTLLLIVVVILAILLTIFLLGLFMIWWVEYRGLGGLTPVQRAYARLGIYGRWLGTDINGLLTPDEQRRRLVEEVPDGREPINTITGLYTYERFAPPRIDQTNADEQLSDKAQQSWTQARMAFIREKINRWLGRV